MGQVRLTLVGQVDREALEARVEVINDTISRYCDRQDRQTRRGNSIVSQKFPNLARLLREYLISTADGSGLDAGDYNWLIAGILDFMIAHQLAFDLEEEALELTLGLIMMQDRVGLLTNIQDVLSAAPQLRDGYNVFIRNWRVSIRDRKPGLKHDDHDFMVLEETMMLVWLALKPNWLAPPEDSVDDVDPRDLESEGFDHRSSAEVEARSVRGGLRLIQS